MALAAFAKQTLHAADKDAFFSKCYSALGGKTYYALHPIDMVRLTEGLPDDERIRIMDAYANVAQAHSKASMETPHLFGKSQQQTSALKRWQEQLKETPSPLDLSKAVELKTSTSNKRVRAFKVDGKKIILRRVSIEDDPDPDVSLKSSFNEVFAYDIAKLFEVESSVPKAEVISITGLDGKFQQEVAVVTEFIEGKNRVRESEKNPLEFVESHKNAQDVLFLEFLLGNGDAHSQNKFTTEQNTLVVFDHGNAMENLIETAGPRFKQALGVVMPSQYSPAIVDKLKLFVAGKIKPKNWKHLSKYQQDSILFRARMLLEDAKRK